MRDSNNNNRNNNNNSKSNNKYKYKYMNEFYDCPQVSKTIKVVNGKHIKYQYIDSITKIPVEFYQLTCNGKFVCKRNCRPEIKKKCTLANFWGYENFEYVDMKNLMLDRLNKIHTKELIKKTKYHNFKCQITLRNSNQLLCKIINRVRCFGLFGNKKIFFAYWDCAEELSLEIFKMIGLDFKVVPELPKLKIGPMVKIAVGIKVKDLWKFSGAMKILHEELQNGRIGFYEYENKNEWSSTTNDTFSTNDVSVAYELTSQRYLNTIENEKRIRNSDYVWFVDKYYQSDKDYQSTQTRQNTQNTQDIQNKISFYQYKTYQEIANEAVWKYLG